MKIFYCGVQYDKYERSRGLSFEHQNFYLSLKELEGINVTYFPFDEIVELGRRAWNKKLLEAVKEQKPDLVFCFMISDEFDRKTLKAIRGISPTLAWFADDHWRFHNYSRYWAPYFSHVATTYSKALQWYERVGISHVIRSQWGANERIYKPVSDMPIDKDRPVVTFVGGWSKPRAEIISALLRAGVRVEAYGGGWSGGRVSDEEMIRIFSVSKINLSLNPAPGYLNKNSLGRLVARRSINRIVPDVHIVRNFKTLVHRGIPQIKGRHFEVAACGGFQITSHADDLENYYTIDNEIVTYRGVAGLVRKIKFYLQHDDKREYIARRGYERTISEHTYAKRFKRIFNEIGLS